MKALIVDTSRMMAQLLGGLRGQAGIDIRIAGSGADALDILAGETVDLLCFADHLGDMAGLDFFVGARAAKLLNLQPSLMFASTHDKRIVAGALEAGVTECFSTHKLQQFEQFIEKFADSGRQRLDGRILLVEDSKPIALFYRYVLEHMGLEVEHCLSAEEATRRLLAEHFDLVITDYVLAGAESGLSVIRHLRAAPGKKARTPILAISGFDDPARKIEILRAGADDFVAKPVHAEELEIRVGNLLALQNTMRRLEAQYETMREMAMHDPLTGLYNRHYLDAISPGLLGEARENGQPLSLLIMDVDHFKRINDGLGHRTGDRVLQEIAALMRRICRDEDLVARVGGEEFVALLPGTPLLEASARAEVLRARIEAALPAGIRVTASIGLSVLSPDDSYDELFRRADDAVYRAKAAGRNRLAVAANELVD